MRPGEYEIEDLNPLHSAPCLTNPEASKVPGEAGSTQVQPPVSDSGEAIVGCLDVNVWRCLVCTVDPQHR